MRSSSRILRRPYRIAWLVRWRTRMRNPNSASSWHVHRNVAHHVANADDPHSKRYLAFTRDWSLPYSRSNDATHASDSRGGHFQISTIRHHESHCRENSHTERACRRHRLLLHSTSDADDQKSLRRERTSRRRAERIRGRAGFTLLRDYAHTPESLRALYDAYASVRRSADGRNRWRTRKMEAAVMGRSPQNHCNISDILPNEDPLRRGPPQIDPPSGIEDNAGDRH